MTMPTRDSIDRLHELALIYLEGLATPDEVVELQKLIAASAEHRDRFVELATRARMLTDAAGAATEASAGDRAGRRQVAGRIQPATGRSWVPPVAIAAAVVIAGLVVGIFVWSQSNSTPEPASPYGGRIAVVLDSRNAMIAHPDGTVEPLTSGDSVRTGPFVLESGSVEFQTSPGVLLRLEAPVSLTVRASGNVALHGGAVTARVPERAIGFTVDTREFDVVDLGTEFTVAMSGGGAGRVFVYEGSVELRWPNGQARRVSAGSAHRVGPDGALAVIDESDATGSAFDWPLGRVDAVPVARGLVGYYRFDGTGDRRVAENLAPGAKLPNGQIIGGRFDRFDDVAAMGIDSADDSIAFDFDQAWPACTIAMRVRLDSIDHQTLTGLIMSQNGGLHHQVESNGNLVFHHYPDSRYSFDRVIREQDLGRWIHLAVTYDTEAGEIAVYRDGELVERRRAANPTAVKPGRCHLGRWTGNESRSLDGAVAELAIYERALNDDEIKRIGGSRLAN